PFFQFGPRYAMATNESLLDGYKKLGKGVLKIYYLLNFATMFTIQTAVTIVTAGLATSLFVDFPSIPIVSKTISSIEMCTIVLSLICISILIFGKYRLLDRFMKIFVITLTISTIIAVD